MIGIILACAWLLWAGYLLFYKKDDGICFYASVIIANVWAAQS